MCRPGNATRYRKDGDGNPPAPVQFVDMEGKLSIVLDGLWGRPAAGRARAERGAGGGGGVVVANGGGDGVDGSVLAPAEAAAVKAAQEMVRSRPPRR